MENEKKYVSGDLLYSRLIERHPLTLEMNTLRQGPDGESAVALHNIEPGTMFDEYIEVWRKLSEEELDPAASKERLSQKATGRRLEYVDRAGAERYDEDEAFRIETDTTMVYYLNPHDFTMHRFRVHILDNS